MHPKWRSVKINNNDITMLKFLELLEKATLMYCRLSCRHIGEHQIRGSFLWKSRLFREAFFKKSPFRRYPNTVQVHSYRRCSCAEFTPTNMQTQIQLPPRQFLWYFSVFQGTMRVLWRVSSRTVVVAMTTSSQRPILRTGFVSPGLIDPFSTIVLYYSRREQCKKIN